MSCDYHQLCFTTPQSTESKESTETNECEPSISSGSEHVDNRTGNSASNDKDHDYMASQSCDNVHWTQITNYAPTQHSHYTETGSQKRKYQIDSMFMGRCETYPKELNTLFKHFYCELCRVNLNSLKTANIHYESKVHDRNITSWLVRNYTDLGLEPPPLKRFYKEGSVGPSAFYCECCDLKLTSKSHADQHFSGRKHKLVVANQSKLPGPGHNNNNDAIRNRTMPSDNNDHVNGKSELFISESLVDLKNSTPLVDQQTEAKDLVPSKPILNDSIFCNVCNISVNSSLQMTLHLEGSKHRKKLKTNGQQPTKGETNDSALRYDISMYRTPSGSFYCKMCNKSMDHQTALVQHLLGKKHIRMSVDRSSGIIKRPKNYV